MAAATAAVALPLTPEVDAPTDNGIRPAELLDRVAGHIRVTAEAGGGEAKLQVAARGPDASNSVRVQGGQVSVNFRADSPAVQHVLANRLPDLVSALTAGGMTVSQANVDVSDQSRQQQGWAQQSGHVAGKPEEDTAAGSSPVDWLQPVSILDLSA